MRYNHCDVPHQMWYVEIRGNIVVKVVLCASSKQDSSGKAYELRRSVIGNHGTLVSKIESPHGTKCGPYCLRRSKLKKFFILLITN